MKVDFYTIFYGIAIFQAFLMSTFFFLNKKGLRSSNRILGTLLSFYGFYLIFLMLASSHEGSLILSRIPALWLLFEFNYCFGPLLYFYTRSAAGDSFQYRLRDTVHFIPCLATAAVAAGVIFKIYNLNWFLWANQQAVIIHLAIYIGVSIYSVRSRIKSPFSPVDDIRLAWLKFLFLAYIVILCTRIFVTLSVVWESYELFIISRLIHMFFIFIFFNATALIALLKPELFSFIVRYQKSVLKDSDRESYKRRIIEAMEQDKAYLAPACTLTSLSKRLSIPVPHLSQIVNETFNLSFPDFINRYRIEESKQYLSQLQDNKMNILEIAFAVGFYSKSSFNSAFKRHTGITPKEYKRCKAA
ncbi:MAG: AraC family transcriptional regulator [Ignavibacteriae bacterium]|nr:MAG: AraC family transcriptional regulator [Ignavibacteriota bacterium]